MAKPYEDETLTFDVKGMRESLSDIITDVSPKSTPFLSNITREPVSSTKFEWLTDALAAPAASYDPQGMEYTPQKVGQPTKLDNYTQITSRTAAVSDTVEVTKRAGRKGELARAMIRKGLEIKLSQNKMLFGTNVAKTVGSEGVAAKTATLLSWIKTNVNKGGGAGANPTGDGTDTRTDGNQRVFTETLLKDVLAQCWATGSITGQRVVYLGPVNIQRASGFTGLATNTNPASSKTIWGVADIYRGQFETVLFVPEPHIRERDAFVISHDYIKLAELRGYEAMDLPKGGDYEAKAIRTEYGLKVSNEKALGLIADLTTT